jgi:hypothetical protein
VARAFPRSQLVILNAQRLFSPPRVSIPIGANRPMTNMKG